MKSLQDIAAAAYHAHQKEERRLTGDGRVWGIRPWSQLSGMEKLCWQEAARQALAEVAAMGCADGLQVPSVQAESIEPLPVLEGQS
jgi:hypothetical protein